MNGIPKPTFTIQEIPNGQWRLTKGGITCLFSTEEEALKGMDRLIKSKMKGYDKDGKLIGE